jgi:hypothetical protein
MLLFCEVGHSRLKGRFKRWMNSSIIPQPRRWQGRPVGLRARWS